MLLLLLVLPQACARARATPEPRSDRGSALDLVSIGAPGNPPSPHRITCCNYRVEGGRETGFGAVAYDYRITRSEVTVGQWVAFLNAVARRDPHGLWHPRMVTGRQPSIRRSGTDGAWTYEAVPGEERTPIRYVSWFDALRFANWLHNGRPVGAQDASTTEEGAYTLLGRDPADVERNPDARYWLANEDEWYKAAFYDPATKRYFRFGYAGDELPRGKAPGEARVGADANLCPPAAKSVSHPCPVHEGPGRLTPVCAYPGRSPWGLCDATGNAIEMTETRERAVETGEAVAVVRGGHHLRGWLDNSAIGRNFISLPGGDACWGCSFRIAARPAD